jgi:hypothetical protein
MKNLLTDIAGVRVGHADDAALASGVAAVMFDKPAVAAACSSLTAGLTKNADGSVDAYFGPQAPAGKEANWVPTKSGGGFEVLFRFYDPVARCSLVGWRGAQ